MSGRKYLVIVAFSVLLLIGSHERVGSAGQARTQNSDPSSVTEVLRVLGKGTDHIVVGEQRLYVIPGISSLVSTSGTSIELSRLRTPCLAEVSYVPAMKGVEKHPVVLHLKVKRVYSGASRQVARE